MSQYSSYILNKKHTKLDSYELGIIWTYIQQTTRNLNGGHNSLVDANTHGDVVVHQDFIRFINRLAYIESVDLIFTTTQQRMLMQKSGVEVTEKDNFSSGTLHPDRLIPKWRTTTWTCTKNDCWSLEEQFPCRPIHDHCTHGIICTGH